MSGSNEGIDATISGLASAFVPGLGHFLLNDQAKRGIVVFLVAGFADILIFTVSFILTFLIIGIFGFFLIPVVHIVAGYDAYNQAEQINAGEIVP